MTEQSYKVTLTEIYNRRALIPFDGSTNQKIIKKEIMLLVKYFPQTFEPFLDVGCGAGWHLEYLSNLGYKNLTGIDLSDGSLKNLKKRTNKSIVLINDDFLTFEFSKKFSCITNYNSCIGQFGKDLDLKFLKKIFQLLRNKSYFILTVFTTNKIENIIGEYDAKYSILTPIKVMSKITYNSRKRILTITQRFLDIFIEEKIKLYSSLEMMGMLYDAGFKSALSMDNQSEYCSTFVSYRD